MRQPQSSSVSAELSARAVALTEAFLADAQSQLRELAEGDLDLLREAATTLRAAAGDRANPARTAEHVAYLLVASAFNRLLAEREAGTGS